MPRLIEPGPQVHESFLAAMREFAAEGRGNSDDDSMVGSDLRHFSASWSSVDGFAAYTAALRAQAIGENLPAGHVPQTTLWWTAGGEYLGRIAIRHELTDHLREVGGHIGYDVRPAARRQGHATAMLRAALPVAHELGIDPALITCDVDNVGSRKTIESNGGVLEDVRNGKLRYWVATAGH